MIIRRRPCLLRVQHLLSFPSLLVSSEGLCSPRNAPTKIPVSNVDMHIWRRRCLKGKYQGSCGCKTFNSLLYNSMLILFICRSKDPNSIYESPYTIHTPSMTTKNNLLSNHPVKSDTHKSSNLTVSPNNGTLGKCKKVYI